MFGASRRASSLFSVAEFVRLCDSSTTTTSHSWSLQVRAVAGRLQRVDRDDHLREVGERVPARRAAAGGRAGSRRSRAARAAAPKRVHSSYCICSSTCRGRHDQHPLAHGRAASARRGSCRSRGSCRGRRRRRSAAAGRSRFGSSASATAWRWKSRASSSMSWLTVSPGSCSGTGVLRRTASTHSRLRRNRGESSRTSTASAGSSDLMSSSVLKNVAEVSPNQFGRADAAHLPAVAGPLARGDDPFLVAYDHHTAGGERLRHPHSPTPTTTGGPLAASSRCDRAGAVRSRRTASTGLSHIHVAE